jgi:5,10-methylene-tetrahydrofolate dehydrogenase/methenyl tetrahydrofolate cyclohydrolase
MSGDIIDGKAISQQIRDDIKEQVDARLEVGKSRPGLATVLVGDDPASHSYVRAKRRSCEQVGIESFHHELPADTPQEEILALIEELNADERVHGILVQLPLPDGIDEEAVLLKVDVEKDVDGFHPMNLGRLAQKGRDPYFTPCTPAGIIELLKRAGAELSGAKAAILGRSNIVGMPVSLLLVKENATITICHSRTKDIPEITREADVLIAAIGRPEMVKGDWIKPGAYVIDVGVNRVDDDSKKKGYRLVGDVAFDEALEVAEAVTPVPGGVGPMTITMLLQNTLRAATRMDPA